MPSASRSSLSHSTKVRSCHRAIADRHHFVEPAARDDEAADMLGEMARERLDLERERPHFLHARALQIDARALELGCAHRAAAHSPDRGGERADGVFRQPEYLADLADGGTAAIGDDGRGNAGMVASIVPINVLDHLFAALVLEIDIDIGRLAAIGGDEALEQQAAVARVDIGDAQAVADRRVCRRAAALTQDVLAARISDDGMDGEKIRRVIELARSAPAHDRELGGHCPECLRDSARRRLPRPDGRALPAALAKPARLSSGYS